MSTLSGRSATTTPLTEQIPRSASGGHTTWVNDWYNPVDLAIDPVQVKLKCWYKNNSATPKSSPIHFSKADVLDLSKWKYNNEVPILDHSKQSEDDQADVKSIAELI